jgi:hypothetical protein
MFYEKQNGRPDAYRRCLQVPIGAVAVSASTTALTVASMPVHPGARTALHPPRQKRAWLAAQ